MYIEMSHVIMVFDNSSAYLIEKVSKRSDFILEKRVCVCGTYFS